MRAWAFARALGVDPGWLVFGEETAVTDPTTVRYGALHDLPMAPREALPRKPTSKRGKRA
ncbi:MAG: hypothetical protein H0U66_00580 [Gemmatimonadaceae bacterium]|nr:hypothetical protein [Gemmatimonadaceae bacterium]